MRGAARPRRRHGSRARGDEQKRNSRQRPHRTSERIIARETPARSKKHQASRLRSSSSQRAINASRVAFASAWSAASSAARSGAPANRCSDRRAGARAPRLGALGRVDALEHAVELDLLAVGQAGARLLGGRLALGLLRRLDGRRLLDAPELTVARVSAGVAHDLSVALEREDRRRHAIEEPAIVRDDERRPVQLDEHLLERGERRHVEVVGRLVEDEQVRRLTRAASRAAPAPSRLRTAIARAAAAAPR